MKKIIAFAQFVLIAFYVNYSLLTMASELTTKNYKVMTGDTLDKVIHKTMPNSPLKVEVLRAAIIAQNEQAFIKGSSHYLIAGSMIKLPNQDELMSKYLSKDFKSNSISMANSEANERKNWIRFP
jgi:Tfp pilus assembly protein FimV